MAAAIGVALLYAGYSVAYYGWNRITGGNDSFRSLFWPGDYKPTARDDGTGSGPTPNPAAAPGTPNGPSTKTAPGTPAGSLGPLGLAGP